MDSFISEKNDSGLTIRRVPISSLHLDPANARSHGEANMQAIVASLQRFGQAEPLVVQAGTGRVIGGNGRLVAMKQLGWSECDIVECEIDDLTATSLGIALNRTGELAEWNDEVLARLLGELRDAEALEGVGYSESDLDALVAELLDGQEKELADPGPGEPPETPVTVAGDIWILGDHRIMCGDSTSEADIAKLMAGEKAHLLATDPPYLVDYKGGNHPQSWANSPETRDKHWDDYHDSEQGLEFFTGFLSASLAHCVDDVPVYQWHAHKRQALVEAAWVDAGLLVHQQMSTTVRIRRILTTTVIVLVRSDLVDLALDLVPPSGALGGSGSLREWLGSSTADGAGSALVEKAPATRTSAEEEALFVGAINLPDG